MKENNSTIEINDENIEKALNLFGITLEANPFELKEEIPTADLIKVEEKNDLNKEIVFDLNKSLGDLGLSVNDLIKAQDIIKSFEKFTDLIKGQSEEFAKREGKYNTRLEALSSELSKSNDIIDDLTKAFDIYKGVEDKLEKAIQINNGLEQRLKLIEETPLPKKSFTKDYLKKGFSDEDLNAGKKVLSMSRDRKQIINTLSARAEDELTKGHIGLFATGVQMYETAKTLPQDLIKELNKEGILIVE